jgi:histidinol-phosphate aminotransferase
MVISRRSLFRHIGVGAAASVGLPSLARTALANGLSRPEAHGAGGIVRLHRNENAYGPSASVIAAIREAAVTLANRYPDGPDERLRNKLATLHAVRPDQVVLGCGSGDILCMAASAFLGPGKTIIVAQPTFDVMGDRARRAGADVITVPLRSDYSYDLDAMLSRANAGTGLVYICNPNNPTGSLTRRRDLQAFIGNLPAATYVLIDEAYHHYVGGSSEYASFIDRPLRDTRVIVTRSFSAIHGLAGLRVGYAVTAPETAAALSRHSLTNNLSGVAALAAMAALDDTEHVRATARRNADDRQEFCNQANARMLRTIDSHANFVMLNTSRPAAEIVEHFKKNGVLISDPFPPFDKYVRVSLGAPAEMREFWRVWDLMPVRHSMTM